MQIVQEKAGQIKPDSEAQIRRLNKEEKQSGQDFVKINTLYIKTQLW